MRFSSWNISSTEHRVFMPKGTQVTYSLSRFIWIMALLNANNAFWIAWFPSGSFAIIHFNSYACKISFNVSLLKYFIYPLTIAEIVEWNGTRIYSRVGRDNCSWLERDTVLTNCNNTSTESRMQVPLLVFGSTRIEQYLFDVRLFECVLPYH